VLPSEPSLHSSNSDDCSTGAASDSKNVTFDSLKTEDFVGVEQRVRASSSPNTLLAEKRALMKPLPHTTKNAEKTIELDNDEIIDSHFSDSNECKISPTKMTRKKRETRQVVRSTSSLRYEPFRSTIGEFHVPLDVWQSSFQGGKIDRPNFGFWMKEGILDVVAPCPIYLSDSGRFSSSRTVVTGYAYCEHRGCKEFKFAVTNWDSNPLVTVFVRGILDHSEGPRTTQSRGVKRQRIKEVLKTTRPSKHMENCIEAADEHMIMAGNLQDMRPPPTIDKVRSEVLAEGDLHTDDIIDTICELRKQECLARRCTQYIQKIADSILVYLYSQAHLEYVQSGVHDIFFDATG